MHARSSPVVRPNAAALACLSYDRCMWEAIAFILETLKSIGKWIIRRHVSREEKEMLVRTLPSGEIYLVDRDQSGNFVRPGDSSHDRHYFN
jgi:hypothetical protein